MEKLTKEQAVAIHDSGCWETWSDEQIAIMQLHQPVLMLPFPRFQQAVESHLGSAATTMSFGIKEAVEYMKSDALGGKPAPTLADLVALLPAELQSLF